LASISTRKTYIDSLYGQVHVRESRPKGVLTNKTPLICLHQSPLSGVQYKIFQEEMAKDRIVWCPDTPGFGGSDAPNEEVLISDYANVMHSVAESLCSASDLPHVVDLFAGHTGSAISIDMAVKYSKVIRKVVLSSVAHFSLTEKRIMTEKFGREPPYFSDPSFVSELYAKTVLNGLKKLSLERRLELFTARLRSGTKAWYAPNAVMNYDSTRNLKSLSNQCLVLVLDDMLKDNSLRAASLISDVTLIERLDIHHSLAFDVHAVEVANIIRDFLNNS
jgi:pimeloyl-ACP methyl ester carboxylesterase